MMQRISGDPDHLEAYTEQTQKVIGPMRNSLDDYSAAVRAFLSATPNGFGTGSIADRGGRLGDILDGLADLDAKPAAFAFALRELDRAGRDVLSTSDTRMFDALVGARLDMPFAASEDVWDGAHMRTTGEELAPEGGLSGADLATIILDLIGVFDPTPISDGASGLLSLFRGEWVQSGLSLAAMVPYLGDTGKVLKFGKMLEKFQHLSKIAGNTAELEKVLKSLKHIDWKNPGKLNEALATMNRLAGDAAKRYSNPKVLEAAKTRGLPTGGPVPFVPPKNWDVKNPPTASFATPGGRKQGILDSYGNGWVWDPTKKEWDVQISRSGQKMGSFSSDGRHANISPDGQVTH